jgi:hypothetical protein
MDRELVRIAHNICDGLSDCNMRDSQCGLVLDARTNKPTCGLCTEEMTEAIVREAQRTLDLIKVCLP